jgi:RNA polymerase sigma-70 factor, ECF subfamily
MALLEAVDLTRRPARSHSEEAEIVGPEPPSRGTAAAPPEDVDADLVEALRLGEPDAADRLVERYGARVYRLALRITSRKEDAEEAAQDALWTVARRIHTFKGESALGTWIYRIAANAAYQQLRIGRRRAHEIALDDVLPLLDGQGRHFEPMDDWSNRVDERALQGELGQVLTEAIEALPADYRTALVLHDVEGLSNPAIAARLGRSVPAVKSRVHRSRLFLRQRLADYMGATSGPASMMPAAS